jgi:hypothetical protein
MKRLFTVLAAIALFGMLAAPAQAQEDKVRLGLQGGVTSSNFSGDDVPDDASSKTGFFAGGYFNYFFAPNWSVAVEGNWLAGVGSKRPSGDIKLSYFEIPLTLNFAFPLGQSEKTWLGLGAGFTALLNLTCEERADDPAIPNFDCKDDTESVAWAVPFGAGIGFKMSDAAVVWLGARYQLGLNDTFSDDTAAKLNIWEFVLGVGFPVG